MSIGATTDGVSQQSTHNDKPVTANNVPTGRVKKSKDENDLLLSIGLIARKIATSGEKLRLDNGSLSTWAFHARPDAARVFALPNNDGWVYVSNSEHRSYIDGKMRWGGGVGGIYFNNKGAITDYKRLMTGGKNNCGAGKTPWNTLVSCEEHSEGQCWEVDPFGVNPTNRTELGMSNFESFAYDYRDPRAPYFFVTEDSRRGALRRYRPAATVVDENVPWKMLTLSEGRLMYLHLTPHLRNAGTFEWTDDFD
eukprot:CAMPEP_0172492326 /NCGR_PEP_ID=MMETSP1066-20121228/23428_1 /TAXON_ID=671091 /ORGANISM="Coscinodiscus wailesii, Strain CCMP2513" /LENGTH=251 /DNA_ID=CAMNT_0013261867 /DNA_START=136 /DNA_END=889 /DNA_ORIENTATION=-